MKKTKGSLTRKTITVRGKGKTYQRSVMVNAQSSAAAKPKGPMNAAQFMRKHGGAILARGAVHGLGSAAGAIAGHEAGVRLGGKSRNAQMLGGHIGSRVGGFVAGSQVGKRLYKGADKRGIHVLADMQRASLGAKFAMIGTHLAGHVAANHAATTAYNRVRGYR